MMHLSRLRPQRWKIVKVVGQGPGAYVRVRFIESSRVIFLFHRNALAGRLVTASVVKDFSSVHEFSSSAGFFSDSAVIRRDDDRVHANHTILRGKLHFPCPPIRPKFVQADNGIYVKKPGSVLLTFWPAIGTRKYDWQKRQAISLSPTEVGSLISLSSGESCEFCHDTSKIESMSSNALKRFVVQPRTEGGHMFHLSVTDIVQKINDRFSVPVTKAEFAVIRTACSFFFATHDWMRYNWQTGEANACKSSQVSQYSKSTDSIVKGFLAQKSQALVSGVVI